MNPPSEEATGRPAPDGEGSRRCFWVPPDNPVYAAYHDEEWGFPVAEDRRLFEKICLEGFQSGLSWWTILRKREAFRAAFAEFDFEKLARFGQADVERLLGDARIVRHRGKIEATINNARRACEMVEREGSLAAYVWRFEPDPKTRPARITETDVRAMTSSPESVELAKDLKKHGWRFFGPTTAYAFMQAMGLVNDHTETCAVRARAVDARARFSPPR
ncbi:MAG: DNA-3-methyladenine glycosylase I [Gemmatimonadota bacterium]|nr:DNA-3-methyladenine glycosylase I [Gemmatimonadota bacterium]